MAANQGGIEGVEWFGGGAGKIVVGSRQGEYKAIGEKKGKTI